ncbi:hypothetical protein Trichorick_01103 [Candidatus Trichorickettsia mobilis]|uniref:Lipoprotein n=1 Tax=Candidatus Trichorickettsia mobilis TaxID=1346319 RepID=A0ABZ0UU68_9RICK|nr:hypothetical protein [Candidatus Trichorickettsia mobilis]WPY01198.1 hypothetical protein Trichorick_01103 [Candidatus Trichorickettsia mobilis]
MTAFRLSLLLCLLICSGCSTVDYYSYSCDQLRQAYLSEQRQANERSNFQNSIQRPKQGYNIAKLPQDWRRERNNPTLSAIEQVANDKRCKF